MSVINCGEGLQMSNGTVTKETPTLEISVQESKAPVVPYIKVASEASNLRVYGVPDVLVKETGYYSEGYNPSVTGSEGSSELGVKHTYLGFLAENKPHMYYGYPSQLPYCPQSSSFYISTGLPGYGPQNGGVPLSYMPTGAYGRYPHFPKLHSAANIPWTGGSKMGTGRPGVGNWRAKDVTKHSSKGDGKTNTSNPTSDAEEQARMCSLAKSKVQQSAMPNTCEGGPWIVRERDMASSSISRSDYNKEDFQISYEFVKFFIIKSYSEDDVHKSIKYGVWSSTPNGNKRLDEAYRAAQEKAEINSVSCPVFFYFSVNSSGQFCGVAEMVGPVDFTKDMDFWLQDKWTGCFPVKWHIIKDVPNGYFRHIILANNENKPVTHSRDTQEVPLKQGLEGLKIFKNFTARTSLLDDFAFYDNRQRLLQDRKMRQQQMMLPVKHETFEKVSVASELSVSLSKENGKLDGLNGVNAKASSLVCRVNDLSITQEDSGCSHATPTTDGKEDATKLQLCTSSEPSVSKPQLPTEVRQSANVIDYKKALLVGGQGNANRQNELDGV